jgi:hypothetical protein
MRHPLHRVLTPSDNIRDLFTNGRVIFSTKQNRLAPNLTLDGKPQLFAFLRQQTCRLAIC